MTIAAADLCMPPIQHEDLVVVKMAHPVHSVMACHTVFALLIARLLHDLFWSHAHFNNMRVHVNRIMLHVTVNAYLLVKLLQVLHVATLAC